jgi:Tfp pilus assembly protein PilF
LREAIRLDPSDEDAHGNLGVALGHKGDMNGEIAEYQKALRLNPNNDTAHYNLGVVFETKGDSQGALQEYRAAYKLDPKNSLYGEAYERLLREVNR